MSGKNGNQISPARRTDRVNNGPWTRPGSRLERQLSILSQSMTRKEFVLSALHDLASTAYPKQRKTLYPLR